MPPLRIFPLDCPGLQFGGGSLFFLILDHEKWKIYYIYIYIIYRWYIWFLSTYFCPPLWWCVWFLFAELKSSKNYQPKECTNPSSMECWSYHAQLVTNRFPCSTVPPTKGEFSKYLGLKRCQKQKNASMSSSVEGHLGEQQYQEMERRNDILNETLKKSWKKQGIPSHPCRSFSFLANHFEVNIAGRTFFPKLMGCKTADIISCITLTPQRSAMDTKNDHVLKESPFLRPIILGIQPLVFGDVPGIVPWFPSNLSLEIPTIQQCQGVLFHCLTQCHILTDRPQATTATKTKKHQKTRTQQSLES